MNSLRPFCPRRFVACARQPCLGAQVGQKRRRRSCSKERRDGKSFLNGEQCPTSKKICPCGSLKPKKHRTRWGTTSNTPSNRLLKWLRRPRSHSSPKRKRTRSPEWGNRK